MHGGAVADRSDSLRDAFGISASDDADARIDKVASELGGSIRDDDLDSALGLLKAVQFSFRHNVFLNISKHLEALANPVETHKVGKDRYENIRVELGGISDIDAKTTKLSTYLARIANDANDAIKDALLASDDRFGEYLSVCMSFFIDYLYRKDDDNFTHFVVRRLISVYRDLILTDTLSVVGDQVKTALIGRIKLAIKEAAVGSAAAAAGDTPSRSESPHRRAEAPRPRPTAAVLLVPAVPAPVITGPAPGQTEPAATAAPRATRPPDLAGLAVSREGTEAEAGGFRSNISFGGRP
jgi:hypothetical protein